MKLSLRQKSWILRGIIAACVLLGVFGRGTDVALIAGVAILIILCPLEIAWRRCPNCGKYLGRNIGYCGHCGEKIDLDAK